MTLRHPGPIVFHYYINKENGMIEKWEVKECTFTYKITENVVTDEDVQKPEDI